MSSRKLIVFAIIISLVAVSIHMLFIESILSATQLFALGGSLALANIAVAIGGLRTPQRLAWGIYLALSAIAYIMLGFATPIGALILLGPMILGL
ncbi:hypothetical protein ACQQ2Q_00950 [Agrobacterium sp. ES01]|uniref:hypothetical protein n=1 Tax=Agrobacterium sp. ES01 TaxID=3420714 RepID=UPI003D11691E